MKKNILVDIDVIIEYLKTGKGTLPKAYEIYKMFITPVTYTELLASTTFKDSKLEDEVEDFIKKYFTINDLSAEMGLEGARIIRENSTNLATALVAASSRVSGMPILTNEPKVFEAIGNIEVVSI